MQQPDNLAQIKANCSHLLLINKMPALGIAVTQGGIMPQTYRHANKSVMGIT
jgi:hypothetical protein